MPAGRLHEQERSEDIEKSDSGSDSQREVQTKEEATVYVRELDSFETVMLLENTPAVLSYGKLCKEFWYSYHWKSGQKPHLIKRGKKIRKRPTLANPFLARPILAKTNFGQIHFGPIQFWPKPILAKSIFGESNFGQSFIFNPLLDLVSVMVGPWRVCPRTGGGLGRLLLRPNVT